MAEAHSAQPELPNILTLLAEHSHNETLIQFVNTWGNVLYSLLIVIILSIACVVMSKRRQMIPQRFQNAGELIAAGFNDFVCGILGPKGKRFTPFIGTLFIYILSMNLIGLIPFMKSSTTSWSTTLALAICVFVYVQYTAFKELGALGYFDHLMGQPRGVIALSVVIPVLMLFLHILAEFVRPISLSLRLRSNIWADDLLFAIVTNFGLAGLPLLLFNTFLAIMAGLIQATVFCLLSTVYFSLVLEHDEHSG
jgi:F-type H+-transporting ATPase subunit a